MKKWKLILGMLGIFGLGIVGGSVANGHSWSDKKVYLGDNLREAIVELIEKNKGEAIPNQLPTISDMEEYTTWDNEEAFSWDGSNSIDGIEHLSSTIKRISLGEGTNYNIEPLFNLRQLEEIYASAFGVYTNDQLEQILAMPNMKKIDIIDSSNNFKDFDIFIPKEITTIKFRNYGTQPTILVEGEKNVVIKSPIKLEYAMLREYDERLGNTKYIISKGNGQVDGENIIIDVSSKPKFVEYKWEYQLKDDSRDYRLEGTVSVPLIYKN